MSEDTNGIDIVDLAYRKYKQHVYYDQLNLVLRKRVAEFEKEFENDVISFDDKLRELKEIVKELSEGELSEGNQNRLNEWIDSIDYHLLPKEITKPNSDPESADTGNFQDKKKGIIIYSNNLSSDTYSVKGINYFIDAPIQLQILCTIWAIKAGRIIDEDLTDSCYSDRLNKKVLRGNDHSSHLYNIYYKEYSLWRDMGISKAISLHKNEKMDVAIVSMDLKQCFYNVVVDFEELKVNLKSRRPEVWPDAEQGNNIELILWLTKIIEKIHERYYNIIKPFLDITHSKINYDKTYPLPIGLISSPILCNWHLNQFDKNVRDKLNPAYYGRYVDDLLFVIANPVVEGDLDNQECLIPFLKKYFLDTGLLICKDEEGIDDEYHLNGYDRLTIQNNKFIIHHYDRNHPCALLQKFKNQIDINSSSFYLLPSNESELDIFNKAYDLIYKGSENVFRNIDSVMENRTAFSKTLTKLIVTLSEADVDPKYLQNTIDHIFRFYKGLNYLNYARFWEKVFSFTLSKKRFEDGSKFYNYAYQSIISIANLKNDDGSEIQKDDEEIKNKLIKDLRDHLLLSLSMPLALLSKEEREIYFEKFCSEKQSDTLGKYSTKFRHSNMVRHYYMTFPLLNYIDGFNGSLIEFPVLSGKSQECRLSPEKIWRSPRHIHFDEYQLFKLFIEISEFKIADDNILDLSEVYNEYKKDVLKVRGHDVKQFSKRLSIPRATYKYKNSEDKSEVSITNIFVDSEEINSHKTELKIGLANIQLSEESIEGSYKNFEKQDLSLKRLMELDSLLNQAKAEKCDFLIFPELSIPYQWLPYMVRYSRRHQIGLIFGLEYWVSNNFAFNFIVTTLPYTDDGKYHSCCFSIRNKNHYSPKEISNLEESGLKIPSTEPPYYYHLIQWKGIQFSVYNCFELADIRHRSLFRSELDLFVACEWNKDVKYFSNIIESSVRDLHCYGVQVNDTKYGDSRIVKPSKSETMNIIQVKGGENCTILVADLDIKKLREFQCLIDPCEYSEFKPLPPGFKRKMIPLRSKRKLNKDKPINTPSEEEVNR